MLWVVSISYYTRVLGLRCYLGYQLTFNIPCKCWLFSKDYYFLTLKSTTILVHWDLKKLPYIISIATHLLMSGYLAFISREESKKPILNDIHIIWDFLNIFSEDLRELSPDRQIKFTINLLLNNVLIFKSLYNYQIELDELKKHIQ